MPRSQQLKGLTQHSAGECGCDRSLWGEMALAGARVAGIQEGNDRQHEKKSGCGARLTLLKHTAIF